MPCAALPPPAPVPWGKKGGRIPPEPNSSSRPRWLLGAVVDGAVAALSVPSYFDGKKLDSGGWGEEKKKGLRAQKMGSGGSEQVWGRSLASPDPVTTPQGTARSPGGVLGLKTSG